MLKRTSTLQKIILDRSPVRHYLLHVLEGEDSSWSDDHHRVIKTNSSDTSFAVSQLNPFTVYSFRVTAVNGVGNSGQSSPSYRMVTLREGGEYSKRYFLLLFSLPTYSQFPVEGPR